MTTLPSSSSKFRARVENFMTGGTWALELPHTEQKNLHWFWLDGLFSAASDVFPLNYLTLFLLAIGASGEQVGAFTALTSLAAAIFLMPGALVEERIGHRQQITIAFGGITARVALLVLAVIPFFFQGNALIWVFIVLGVIRAAAGNFAFSPWIAMVNDIVPIQGRGRYFGSRNTAMTLAVIIVTWLVGTAITRLNGIPGHQWMLALSVVFGLISTYAFARIKDPKPKHHTEAIVDFSLRGTMTDLISNRPFFYFTIIFAVWNFVLFFSAPFFNVYMVDDLKFTPESIGYVFISASIFRMLTQQKAGEWADKFGEGRMLTIMMFLIPILPILWMLSSNLWQVILVNGLAGLLWGIFELSSFNYLLHITPNKGRGRFSALYQVTITLAASAGAAVGTVIYNRWGIPGAFISSGVGRFFTAAAFMWLMMYVSKHQETNPPALVSPENDPNG